MEYLVVLESIYIYILWLYFWIRWSSFPRNTSWRVYTRYERRFHGTKGKIFPSWLTFRGRLRSQARIGEYSCSPLWNVRGNATHETQIHCSWHSRISLPSSLSPLSLSLSPAMNAKSGHDGVRTTPLTMTKRKSTQFHPPSACTHGRKADLLRALPPLPPAPSSQWYIKLATNLWRIISNEYIFFTGNSHQLRVTAYLHGIWKTNRKKEGIEGGACTERGMEKETVDG